MGQRGRYEHEREAPHPDIRVHRWPRLFPTRRRGDGKGLRHDPGRAPSSISDGVPSAKPRESAELARDRRESCQSQEPGGTKSPRLLQRPESGALASARKGQWTEPLGTDPPLPPCCSPVGCLPTELKPPIRSFSLGPPSARGVRARHSSPRTKRGTSA